MTHSQDTAGWDQEVDVLVAGSGIGGLGTAVIAASHGAEVAVVEKAATIGGTTAKSAAYMWIPNNRFLRASGRTDPRPEALRYMARLSRPRLYDPDSPTLGLPAWEYRGIAAFYDHASEAAETYERLGVLEFGHAADFPDYYAHIQEDAAPTGRILFPAESQGGPTGGRVLVDKLAEACERANVPITVEARVTRVVLEDGAVVGAEIEQAGVLRRVRTRRGVVFATGGFTQDPGLRLQYLDQSYVGGCAARTNTGDLLSIAREAGADLVNLNLGMRAPMVLERLVEDPAGVRGSFMIPGDSLIVVNRFGRRVVSEKLPYHDFARTFFAWDGQLGTYPNNPLIAIWDEAATRFGGEGFGNLIPAPGDDPYWVVTADSLADLEQGIAARLDKLRPLTGQAELDAGFGTALAGTVERWNGMATEGVDHDFGRGSTPIEQGLSAYFGWGDGPNPMMAPLSGNGPYHATVLGPALIDTAGGPRCEPDGQVLRPDGDPIPGLFAVGNCAAAPSGEAYWAGGHTIGLIQCSAYLAGRAVAA
ncbi:FAD-dependent oxidoreductase [Pseudonocardia sp. NPDC049635]|uniref:FAD-dependent oxidoreductase n=1 Tax=Pseudonocardia sp. NPDC049635 TaxID=3155506 RepID=UPI0033FDF21F